jgi:hypothetical protein
MGRIERRGFWPNEACHRQMILAEIAIHSRRSIEINGLVLK